MQECSCLAMPPGLVLREHKLGLASSIAMAGKRHSHMGLWSGSVWSSMACRPARKGEGRAGQGKGRGWSAGRYRQFDNNSQENNPKPAPPLFWVSGGRP